MVSTAGYSPTFSWIGNPKASQLQAVAIRYQAPMLNALERFKLPRIVINNDPRTYPKDQEMSYGWKYARPQALLDQCDDVSMRVVGGKTYRRVCLHARSESWAYHIPTENTDEVLCTAVHHAHIKDGCKTGSSQAWDAILKGTTFPVYGKGWEKYEGYDPQRMPGCITPAEVREKLRISTCAPVVSNTPGFYTGKPYVLMSCGCIPILFGSRHSHTYDPKQLFLPFDSPWRVKRYGDMQKILERVHCEREELRAHWREVLQPDWKVLDEVVDKLLAGKFVDGEYGGYHAV
jgi:hypothetical protein